MSRGSAPCARRVGSVNLFEKCVFSGEEMLGSIVCRYDAFRSDWFSSYADRINRAWRDRPPHRKLWEWCAISHALQERDMLRDGRLGIGFAVGKEPLPSLFAGFGVQIIATDLGLSGANLFEKSGVHAASLGDCYRPHLVSKNEFERLVHFQPADMRDLSNFESECADFIWSSCAMEHLGTLQAGIDYVLSTIRLLKPGGVSVNTTEFNVGSEKETITSGENVVYRRCDLEELAAAVRHKRSFMAPLSLELGQHRFDLDYDEPPYSTRGGPHITLKLNGHICTSVMLIVQKL